jgi:hypothetical protein
MKKTSIFHSLYSMEILFRTKAESNQQQRETFLKLSPAKRFEKFLEMMEAFEVFPVKGNIEKREKSRESSQIL